MSLKTKPRTKEEVLALAEHDKVRFVLLQFTDILGVVKSVSIPVSQLEKALDGQIMFDGSSVHGFVRIEESDMLLKPDPTTYALFPWLSQTEGNTARLICDIYTPNDEPFAGCPRLALKRAMADAQSMGYKMFAGLEAEFFLFHLDDKGLPTVTTQDQGSYFDLSPIDTGESARRDMVVALEDLGFDIEAAHHEVAPAQHEIDTRYSEAVTAGDDIVTLRLVVRTMALQNKLHATFMPKPVHGINGSGMHMHQSLFSGDVNVFYDKDGSYQLSDVCQQYLAGILKHARGFTALTNPLINSYKRLVPGYEAPVYLAWSERNRSPLIRVPARRGVGTRLELRSPDPSCNPYLALTVSLAAGLDGIKKGLVAPPPVNRNIYEMDLADRQTHGIGSLPGSLEEALDELLNDDVICAALGDHIVGRFVDAKRIETDVYRTQVHQWELDQYLRVY